MDPPPKQPSSTFDWIASVATVGVFAAGQLGEEPARAALQYLGVACLALALPLFVLPFLHLTRYGAPAPGQSFVHTTRVADRGLYSVVRHPQYLGYSLLVAGFALISPNAGSLTLALVAVVGFVMQAKVEERFLRVRMGSAYAAYAQRVPRFNVVRGMWRRWRGGGGSAQ
jgi:protein-S-isoprenylcysteine O-methyltransferase Ste14